MKKVKIIENRSELGAGTRGAGLGPGAIRVASLNKQSDLFGRISSVSVETENELLFHDTDTQWGKRIEGIYRIYERVAKLVKDTLAEDTFPIVLAGDHSSAGGTIAGIKMANPEARIGLIWIDAHADIHSPYTTPSGNVHGMPVATALGQDNKDCKVNDPDPVTIEYWEKMKHLGEFCPKAIARDLVFIALRDFEEPEAEWIKREGIKVYPVAEVREKGVKEITKNVLDYLKQCDLLYVTFDVDSMDSSISMGTGTPVANGLTIEEASNFVFNFMKAPQTACLEITEVNPTLDDKINKMAEIAFDVLEKSVDIISHR